MNEQPETLNVEGGAAVRCSALLGILEPIPSWMFGNSVEARNALQNCGRVHPYTCGNDRTDEAHRKYQAEHGGDFGQLVAVEDGWLCPVCGYTQKLRMPNEKLKNAGPRTPDVRES